MTSSDGGGPGQVRADGPTRPGHGVVVVEREPGGTWCATWLDLGAVEVVGDLDRVLAWALEQPAAEHVLSVPELGGDVSLRVGGGRGVPDGRRHDGAASPAAHVLAHLSGVLDGDVDVVELFQAVTERSVRLLGVDAAVLLLVDRDGVLQLVGSTARGEGSAEVLEGLTRRGPGGDVLRSAGPVVDVDLSAAEERWPGSGAAAGRGVLHVWPVRLGGEAVGVLSVLADPGVRPDADVLAVGQSLADLAVVGLLREGQERGRQVLAEQLRAALEGRVLVGRATGVLAGRTGTGVEAALTTMRDHARRHGVTLTAVAASVVDGTFAVEAPA